MSRIPDASRADDPEGLREIVFSAYEADRYWQEREEYENTNPLVLDCGNLDCIMSGYHRLSECVTVEMMEQFGESVAGGVPDHG